MKSYLFEQKIIVDFNKHILIKSKEPITNEIALCIELAYMYISNEYKKLSHIMNQENRILEAKYNAIETMQSDCETPQDERSCNIISQYIINLEL